MQKARIILKTPIQNRDVKGLITCENTFAYDFNVEVNEIPGMVTIYDKNGNQRFLIPVSNVVYLEFLDEGSS